MQGDRILYCSKERQRGAMIREHDTRRKKVVKAFPQDPRTDQRQYFGGSIVLLLFCFRRCLCCRFCRCLCCRFRCCLCCHFSHLLPDSAFIYCVSHYILIFPFFLLFAHWCRAASTALSGIMGHGRKTYGSIRIAHLPYIPP